MNLGAPDRKDAPVPLESTTADINNMELKT